MGYATIDIYRQTELYLDSGEVLSRVFEHRNEKKEFQAVKTIFIKSLTLEIPSLQLDLRVLQYDRRTNFSDLMVCTELGLFDLQYQKIRTIKFESKAEVSSDCELALLI